MKRWSSGAVAVAIVAWAAATAAAEVRLPKFFGNSMVLQQKQPVKIWGWAEPGEEVTVTLADARQSTQAGADGRWQVSLAPPAAGGPYEATIRGANEIKLTDVLVGEVWICSGQSNMQWSVAQSANPEEERQAANWPQIRMFTVARHPAAEPQTDVQGDWKVCSPANVSGFSAVGYYFARKLHQELDVPVGMINTSWGGTICEAWTSRPTLETDADFAPILERSREFKPGQPNQASVLYNGMVHPLVPLSIRGAIWYQGESNVGRAEQYRKLFPAMIGDWRKQWSQGEFPFIFVQLAPYRYGNNDPALCAELWEAQAHAAATTPNVGMAVTTDIGNVKDIHPKNKQDVGARLARWALHHTYGQQDVVYSGPRYEGQTIEGNKIRLKFGHAHGGLVAKDSDALTHFTIAGDDGVFHEARAVIDGATVVVSSESVPKPAYVRFAWRDDAEPNFFNGAGLPASPFRTDALPLLTAGRR